MTSCYQKIQGQVLPFDISCKRRSQAMILTMNYDHEIEESLTKRVTLMILESIGALNLVRQRSESGHQCLDICHSL